MVRLTQRAGGRITFACHGGEARYSDGSAYLLSWNSSKHGFDTQEHWSGTYEDAEPKWLSAASPAAS